MGKIKENIEGKLETKFRKKSNAKKIMRSGLVCVAVFAYINWEEKKELVEYGDIDCIWGSFTIDGREEEYNWTGPYMISRQVVAVNEDSDIYSLSDLKGKK